jgi:hypothetical protein
MSENRGAEAVLRLIQIGKTLDFIVDIFLGEDDRLPEV